MYRSSKGFHPLSFFDKMNVCIFYLSMHATSLIHLTLPELMQEDEVDRAKKIYGLWISQQARNTSPSNKHVIVNIVSESILL